MEIKNRKPTRLKEYDYGTPGAYFVTICTQNRRNILSTIVGEGSPLPKLKSCGMVAEKWIRKISEQYKEISVDCYVIMPNHIHLLLSVTEPDGRGDPSPTIDGVVGWLKYHITAEINSKNNTSGEKVFQRSFYDHVIRNDRDYSEIYKYIYENPLRWKLDKLYAEES